MAQEESDTYQCVTSVVTGGIDDSSVAFTTDNSSYFFHLGRDIYFAYS